MFRCTNCKHPYPDNGLPYICPNCRGIFDIDRLPIFDRKLIQLDQPGIWKYRHTFGLPEDSPVVSLGEGNTPLIWVKLDGHDVAFKVEFQNPTGSFLDRGSALIVSFLCTRQVRKSVDDSSGNAGASFAAYAASKEIDTQIFLPDETSIQKQKQIEAYGARITKILGPRSNSAVAVKPMVASGILYASHVYLPFNMPGYATISYELLEQLGESPGTILMPVGNGELLLGVGRGFETLKNAGEIDRIPKLYGIQARACAPLWAVFEYGPSGLMWVSEGHTMADEICVKNPIRGDAVLNLVRKSHGKMIAVDEDDIISGVTSLARHGFHVEPTAAVVWEPLLNIIEELTKPVVVVLTGSGLKY